MFIKTYNPIPFSEEKIMSGEDNKDLAAVFEEQTTRIKALETKFAEFEQRKPYGEPFGEPFIKSVLALITKIGAKDIEELKEKLKAMTGEVFISAEDEADCKTKGGKWVDGKCVKVEETGERRGTPIYALPTGELHDTSDAQAKELATKIMGGAI